MLGCRPSLAPGVDDPMDVTGIRHSNVSLETESVRLHGLDAWHAISQS
jgi:hypothetical protein